MEDVMDAPTRRRRLKAWMRRRGPTTVGEAAIRFGVTERTIFRDIARMRAAGIQVDGDPGRGGGIWLRVSGRRDKPVG
jgi:predicted DNA-binding transcriptional regulator YafY